MAASGAPVPSWCPSSLAAALLACRRRERCCCRGPPLVLQCGRVGKDTFVCDHNDNAMSGLQAFAIALAVFTWRPHYLWF